MGPWSRIAGYTDCTPVIIITAAVENWEWEKFWFEPRRVWLSWYLNVMFILLLGAMSYCVGLPGCGLHRRSFPEVKMWKLKVAEWYFWDSNVSQMDKRGFSILGNALHTVPWHQRYTCYTIISRNTRRATTAMIPILQSRWLGLK